MKALTRKQQLAEDNLQVWRKSCYDSAYALWRHTSLDGLLGAERLYRRHLACCHSLMDRDEAQNKLDAIHALLALVQK